MDKMKFETPDMAQMNVEKIAALFPNCVTESKAKDGKLKKAVNFDALKQMLGESVAEGDESYEFTWVGKRDAMVEAAKPIRKTLRPCVEESKNFDTTENLYIEGDNLEALKLLQEGYLGKVKMIYIDPPYNTGNDFIYKDDFRMDSAKYAEESGAVDDEGNRMVQNSDSNGRFHSDWCSMIYSRLLLARNLLTDDGVIFISIDDNEQANLKKICDEVFGIKNFVSELTIIVKPEGRRYGSFAKTHEYCLVYAANIDLIELNEIEVEGAEYQYFDDVGGFNLKGLRNRNVQAFNSTNRPNLRYPFYVNVMHPDTNGLFEVSTISRDGWQKVEASIIDGLKSVWRWGKETAEQKRDQLTAYKGPDGNIRIYQKERKLTQTAKTVWMDKEIISNKGTKEVQDLLGKGIFDFPKPIEFLKKIITIGSNEGDLILDFFSGSATLAHSIMLLNSDSEENRKFIMVQLPEKCDENSEAAKAGYKTICEIGKERIRRAGDKILAEQQAKEKSVADKTDLFESASDKPATVKPLDIGFRVLKIDDSNMKDVYYSAGEISQQDLVEQISNIKDGRTDLDLLFGCLVDWGVSLSLPIKNETIENVQVYNVNDGDLVACFANDIPEAAIRQIAAAKPLRAVFRDSSFKSDSAKINVTEIFKTISPNTTVKVV